MQMIGPNAPHSQPMPGLLSGVNHTVLFVLSMTGRQGFSLCCCSPSAYNTCIAMLKFSKFESKVIFPSFLKDKGTLGNEFIASLILIHSSV